MWTDSSDADASEPSADVEELPETFPKPRGILEGEDPRLEAVLSHLYPPSPLDPPEVDAEEDAASSSQFVMRMSNGSGSRSRRRRSRDKSGSAERESRVSRPMRAQSQSTSPVAQASRDVRRGARKRALLRARQYREKQRRLEQNVIPEERVESRESRERPGSAARRRRIRSPELVGGSPTWYTADYGEHGPGEWNDGQDRLLGSLSLRPRSEERNPLSPTTTRIRPKSTTPGRRTSWMDAHAGALPSLRLSRRPSLYDSVLAPSTHGSGPGLRGVLGFRSPLDDANTSESERPAPKAVQVTPHHRQSSNFNFASIGSLTDLIKFADSNWDSSHLFLNSSPTANFGSAGSEFKPNHSPKGERIFDHFVVVGVPRDVLEDVDQAVLDDADRGVQPRILYRYPPDEELNAEAVADFCFPGGVQVSAAGVDTSRAAIMAGLELGGEAFLSPSGVRPYVQQQQHQQQPPPQHQQKGDSDEAAGDDGTTNSALSPNELMPLASGLTTEWVPPKSARIKDHGKAREAVFILSGGGSDGSDQAYGICLYEEALYRKTSGRVVHFQRCLCFISHLPSLRLHFGVLRQIAWLDRRRDLLSVRVGSADAASFSFDVLEKDVREIKVRAASVILRFIQQWIRRRQRRRRSRKATASRFVRRPKRAIRSATMRIERRPSEMSISSRDSLYSTLGASLDGARPPAIAKRRATIAVPKRSLRATSLRGRSRSVKLDSPTPSASGAPPFAFMNSTDSQRGEDLNIKAILSDAKEMMSQSVRSLPTADLDAVKAEAPEAPARSPRKARPKPGTGSPRPVGVKPPHRKRPHLHPVDEVAKTEGKPGDANRERAATAQTDTESPGLSDAEAVPGAASPHEKRSEDVRWTVVQTALNRYYDLPVPLPGEEVKFSVFQGLPRVQFVRPKKKQKPHHRKDSNRSGSRSAAEASPPRPQGCNVFNVTSDEEAALIGEWGLPLLCRRLTIDNILLIVGCTYAELQVVFYSPDLEELSACVLAVLALLRPLQWAGALLVMLPRAYHAYLESPVPLIAGVDKLPSDFEVQEGVILVELAKNTVRMHAEDAKKFHSLMIPEASRLCHDLSVQIEAINSPEETAPYDLDSLATHNRKRLHSIRNEQKLLAGLRDAKTEHTDATLSDRLTTGSAVGDQPVPEAMPGRVDKREGQEAGSRLSLQRALEKARDTCDASLRAKRALALSGAVQEARRDPLVRRPVSPCLDSYSRMSNWTARSPVKFAGDGGVYDGLWEGSPLKTPLTQVIRRIRKHLGMLLKTALQMDAELEQSGAGELNRRRTTSIDQMGRALRSVQQNSRNESGETDGSTPKMGHGSVSSVRSLAAGEAFVDDGALGFLTKLMESQMFNMHWYALRQEQLEATSDVNAQLSSTLDTTDSRVSALDQAKPWHLHHDRRQIMEDLFYMIIAGDAPPSGNAEPPALPADAKPRPLWCNGHCEGRMDTANCTLLCLEEWQLQWMEERRDKVAGAAGKGSKLRGQGRLPPRATIPLRRKLKSQKHRRFRTADSYHRRRRTRTQWHKAASVITRFLRRVAAARRWDTITTGLTAFQARFRGYTCRRLLSDSSTRPLPDVRAFFERNQNAYTKSHLIWRMSLDPEARIGVAVIGDPCCDESDAHASARFAEKENLRGQNTQSSMFSRLLRRRAGFEGDSSARAEKKPAPPRRSSISQRFRSTGDHIHLSAPSKLRTEIQNWQLRRAAKERQLHSSFPGLRRPTSLYSVPSDGENSVDDLSHMTDTLASNVPDEYRFGIQTTKGLVQELRRRRAHKSKRSRFARRSLRSIADGGEQAEGSFKEERSQRVDAAGKPLRRATLHDSPSWYKTLVREPKRLSDPGPGGHPSNGRFFDDDQTADFLESGGRHQHRSPDVHTEAKAGDARLPARRRSSKTPKNGDGAGEEVLDGLIPAESYGNLLAEHVQEEADTIRDSFSSHPSLAMRGSKAKSESVLLADAASAASSLSLSSRESAHGLKVPPQDGRIGQSGNEGGCHASASRHVSVTEQDIEDMIQELCSTRGIPIRKFGRQGKPHPRVFMLDAASGHLFWFSPRPMKSAWRWVRKLVTSPDHFRTLQIGDIEEVLSDKSTPVCVRALRDGVMNGTDLVVSVVARRRTLDFSVDDYDTFSVLLRALRTLVERENAGVRVVPRELLQNDDAVPSRNSQSSAESVQ